MKYISALAAAAFVLFVPRANVTAQVVINEIGYDVLYNGETQWVELLNTGATDADVSAHVFCNYPNYSGIGTLGVLSGSTTIPPGGLLVVKWSALGLGNGEIGYYKDSLFDQSTSILDYVEYGSSGHTRSSVATAAGLWAENEVVPAANPGESLARVDGSGSFAAKWASGVPTPGAPNAGSTGIENRVVDPPLFIGRPYPNPADQSFDLRISLQTSAMVVVETFDLLGRRVTEDYVGDFGSGEYSLRIETANLPQGLYLARVAVRSAGLATAALSSSQTAMVVVTH